MRTSGFGAVVTLAAALCGAFACTKRPELTTSRDDAGTPERDGSLAPTPGADASQSDVPNGIDDANDATAPDDNDVLDATLGACVTDCLPTEFANWRMPNAKNLPLPNPARLTPSEGISGDISGETVEDEITGLSWSVAFSERVSFAGAEEYCGALRAADGMNWRVPTRIELVTLLDRTQFPTIDRASFPDTPEDYFWSSSLVPDEPGARYSVYFGVGETAWGAEDQVAAHTRCVNGGFRQRAPQYEVSEQHVEDRATRLVWQRDAPTLALGIEAARTYCTTLATDGARWRVPSGKELQTLVQPFRAANSSTLLDGAAFPGASPETTWGDEGSLVQPMALRVADGFTGIAETGASHGVRCVR